MHILRVLFDSYLLLLGLACAWLVLLTLGAWFFRRKVNPEAAPLKMGVLVPAHNEELQLPATIAAIRRCSYPEGMLEIFVIADNCTDKTAEVARSEGVTTVERTNPDMRGKGQALDWFLTSKQELYASCDVITIIDADVEPENRYFLELSASLSHPEVQVVQAYNGVSNPYDSWRTALMSAAFNVFNHLRMAGNITLFGTAMLKGNGMAFETEILKKYGWPAHSVVEDVEFSLLLLEDHVNVHYNPRAVIRSEMAVSHSQGTSQRERWEGGRFALAADLIPRLAGKCLQGQFRFFHALMDLAVPPLSVLVLAVCAALVIAALLFRDLLGIPLVYLGAIIFYVASGQLQMHAPLRLWCSLAAAPLFVFWKLIIYVKMAIFGKGDRWVRTTRKAELEDKDNT